MRETKRILARKCKLYFSIIIVFILLSFDSLAISVGFSAGNGGESVSLSSNYDVGTDVSVSEESTASFDQLAIENTRSVSGTGDINVVQTYSGSGGYRGSANFMAVGTGSLSGSASLNPESMNAMQDISALGESSADMALEYGGIARVGCDLYSGSINSVQSIHTGSGHGSQNVQGSGSLSASVSSSENSLSAMQEAYVIGGVLSTHQNAATDGSTIANQITTLNDGIGGVYGYALGQNNFICVAGDGQILDPFEAGLSSIAANRGYISGSAINGGTVVIDDNDLNELNQMSNAMHSASTTYLDGKKFFSYMSTDDTIPINELLLSKLESEKTMYGLVGIQWKGLNPNIPLIIDETSIPKYLNKDDVYRDIDLVTEIWDDATNRQLFAPVEHEKNINPPKLADDKRDYKNTISWTPLGKNAIAQTGWWAGNGPDPEEDPFVIG